jgi:HK97 family phage major capsid protein
MENIAQAVAAKLEETILGTGAGSVATEPTGLFYDYEADAATTLSWDAVVALESDVDADNALVGSLAYITTATGRGALKTTVKASSSDSVMIMEQGEVNGYPVYVSNGVAGLTDFTTTDTVGLIFGNWSDLIIGQWGGYDLLVDPYTQAALGTVRLVVNAYFDAAAARSVSFSAINIRP